MAAKPGLYLHLGVLRPQRKNVVKDVPVGKSVVYKAYRETIRDEVYFC
jgi:hypothetical protein